MIKLPEQQARSIQTSKEALYGQRSFPTKSSSSLVFNTAKEKGMVKVEGKEYMVNDGDVVLFRFNV